jgi:anhydro-N-acetylmuramic acid kinase
MRRRRAQRDAAARTAARLPGTRVATTASAGVDPDWVEAMAFAWLARQAIRGEAGSLPEVTGALGPRVLGAVYPA